MALQVNSMRIAVGQLWQETNTFNRNPTTLIDFENWDVAHGPEILASFGETGEIGGFVSESRSWNADIEFAGLARYVCWPWGAVNDDTWQHIQTDFAERLQSVGKVDAVFLALHGAMAAGNELDITGTLLQQVRATVGPNVPIVGSLDLHANITHRMLANADVLCGYHACPHLDSVETGARASRALNWLLESRENRPATYWKKLPMITAAENHDTFTGPPAALYRKLEQLEAQDDVLSAGLYMAMPWFDGPKLGWVVYLTVKKRNARYEQAVAELAEECWNIKETMDDVSRLKPAEVVERALAAGGYPVVIGDGADATNSGSPGDNTTLLQEFLRQESIPHGALTFLIDPEAVAIAHQMGEGGSFHANVGAAFSPEYSEPVSLRGTVEKLLQVDFILDGHIGSNMAIRMGRGAVIKSGDVSVLLAEKSGPGSTPRLYETAGLDPREFGIVVAKSPAGFRAEYGDFAHEILLVDSPGCAASNFQRLNFLNINRPIWPLDNLSDISSVKWCESGWL